MCENDLGKILTPSSGSFKRDTNRSTRPWKLLFFGGDRSSFLRNRFVHIHTHTFFEGKVNLGPIGAKRNFCKLTTVWVFLTLGFHEATSTSNPWNDFNVIKNFCRIKKFEFEADSPVSIRGESDAYSGESFWAFVKALTLCNFHHSEICIFSMIFISLFLFFL